MRYQNPDPLEKKKAQEIIDEMLALYDDKIDDCIKRNFYNKINSVIARELQYDVCDGLSKKFGEKLSTVYFFDTGAANNNRSIPTDYDRFWNNVVIHDSDSESVKKHKMQLQDKLRGIVHEQQSEDFEEGKK